MDRWAQFAAEEIDGSRRRAVSSMFARRWHGLTPARQLLLGCLVAVLAVGIRYVLPLPPSVLPTFTLVIAVCVVTAVVGLWAGMSAAVLGGILTWRYIYTPGSWDLGRADAIGLMGYFTVAGVILCTAELYRRSEARWVAAQLSLAEQELSNQQLFADELSHRLKNSLSIVQSIALQSFKGETPEFQKFAGRLHALAAANSLLQGHVNRPTAEVGDVVEAAVGPFMDRPAAFHLDGPSIALPSQDVVSLTMALHELATNAVKYGALSDPEGHVDVSWRLDDGKFVLEWKEHDGPPVKKPTRQGFGSRLLRRAAMGSDLQFEPDGIRCTIKGR